MSIEDLSAQPFTTAWVVFTDETRVLGLRFLRRGFRHCFVLLEAEDVWVSVDPLLSRISIMTHAAPAVVNLPKYLRECGYTIIKTDIKTNNQKQIMPGILHCVAIVKRIIGVHNWRVVTPWQLYNFLQKQNSFQQMKGGADAKIG